MSNYKKSVLIYQNLPSGGAKSIYESNTKFLKRKRNIKVIEYADNVVIKNLFHYLVYANFIAPAIHRKIANSADHDILISHHSWITKAPHIIQFTSKPVVYICQELPREYYDKAIIRLKTVKEKIIDLARISIKRLDRNNIAKAKHITIVANSKYESKMIQKVYGVKTKVIYPGINLDEFKNFPIRTFKKRKYTVLCVGAINKHKNQLFLVKAISAIDPIRRPKLVLVGNGFDKNYLKDIKSKAKRKKVELSILTNISKNKLRKQYIKADIFAYCPVSEPFGIVILEAMASGLPIIFTSNSGGYTEILSKRNGVACNSVNFEKFGHKIQKLLSNEKARKNISKNNTVDVRKYSIDITNQKIWQLIQKLS